MKRLKMEFTATETCRISEVLRNNLSRKFYRNLKNRNLQVLKNDCEAMCFQECVKDDHITIFFDYVAPNEWEPIDGKLEILFENENYLAVYKKNGLLTIPTKGEPVSLYQMILYYFKENNIENTIHFINRLDKDTEGIVLVAKNRFAAYSLNSNKSSITRKYLALCHGEFTDNTGIINLGIARDIGTKRMVSDDGKESITEYKVISYEDGLSLVELHLKTGRTHQIRVHLQYLGHPIVGDKIYYNEENTFLHLCSYFLEFNDPLTNEAVSIKIKPRWM